MSTPVPPGQQLVKELRQLAAAGVGDRSLSAIGEILQQQGLQTASASSLSRLARGSGRPPRGPDDRFRNALRAVGGTAANNDRIERLVALRAAASAAAPIRPPRPGRKARTYRALDAADQAAARAFVSALVRLLAGDTGRQPSARALAKLAHIGTTPAGSIFDGRVAIPADHVADLLDQAVDQLGPRRAGQVAAMAARYLRDIAVLDPSDTADERAAIQRITAHRHHAALDTSQLAAHASGVERLRTLSRRNRDDADVLLAPDREEPLRLRDLYVTRRVESDARLTFDAPALTVVVGDPGDGKSSLLWRLADRSAGQGRDPILLRATDVPGLDLHTLRGALAPTNVGPAVLLIDTVDLLLRTGEAPTALRDLLDVTVAAGAATVLTCRTRESQVLRRIGATADPQFVRLGPYDADELPHAVAVHARHLTTLDHTDGKDLAATIVTTVARGLPLREVCQRPLTLRMLFELGLVRPADRQGPAEIDVTTLYARYWDLRVRDDVRSTTPAGSEPDAAPAAELTAVAMMAAGLPQLEHRDLDHLLTSAITDAAELRTGLRELRRRGVFADPTDGSTVEFFHQTFFEYAAAHALLALGPDITAAALDRAQAEPNELFFAAVAQQLLVLAASTRLPAPAVDDGLAQLLTSDNPNVVQMAVAAYAQSRHRGPAARQAAQALLSTAPTGVVRRYLTYLPRVWHGDTYLVLNELQTLWQRTDLVTEARVDVLTAARALAAMNPGEVLSFLIAGGLDWPTWYTTLTDHDARRLRGAPLALITELAATDTDWATTHLAHLAQRVSVGSPAQDALADVLGVAATVGADPMRMLNLVPASVKADASGIGPLKNAMAGLWLQNTGRPEELLAAALEPCTDGAGLVRRRAVLLALAESLHSRSDDAAHVVDTLSGSPDPRLQADAVDCLLRRLLEGRDRPQLPCGPAPADTPTTLWAHNRCSTALEQLSAPDPDATGARSEAALWRDAVDHARLRPSHVAAITAAMPSIPDDAWTDPQRLAVLTAPAALGGNPSAAAALRRWSLTAASPDSTARKIIASRLVSLTTSEPEAIEYLLADATTHQDARFLTDAVLQNNTKPATTTTATDPILSLAHTLRGSPHPKVRRDAYLLLTALGSGATVPASVVVAAARSERAIGADNAALALVEASIVAWGNYWTGSAVAELDDALTQRGDARPKDATACRRLRRELLCRRGDLTNADRRRETIELVRHLALATPAQETLGPLAYLLQRLAVVDTQAAADLLVKASQTVHGMPDGSWKARRAHRWRPGIAAVLEHTSPSTWRHTMEQLVVGDPEILIQAIGISIAVRADSPAETITQLLPPTPQPGVAAELRNARLRRQRVTGGTQTWTAVQEAWTRQHRAR